MTQSGSLLSASDRTLRVVISIGDFTMPQRSTHASRAVTLTDKLWAYLQGYAAKHKAAGNGFGLVGPDDTCRTLSARYYKDGFEILVSRGKGKNPRRLRRRAGVSGGCAYHDASRRGNPVAHKRCASEKICLTFITGRHAAGTCRPFAAGTPIRSLLSEKICTASGSDIALT